jgi:hypothetical protein
MGSYKQIVDACRSAATTVNASGTFGHGRIVAISQESIEGVFPYIALYPFNTSGVSVDDATSKANPILLGFWEQDTPDSSMEDQEAIIDRMDELADAFLVALSDIIDIRSFVKEPQYQFYNGTVSGVAVKIEANVAGVC